MDTRKMGSLISNRRKEKQMTQKELADKLNVTDKAVSKWERGLSYPDISLIVPLAEILEVTASQLLKGEMDQSDEKNDDDQASEAVLETISYAQKSFKKALYAKEGVIIGILSLLCLIAVFVCTLCNVVINHTFSWSLIVAGGIAIGWLVLVPIIRHKWKGVMIGLISISLLSIPYLYLIESQTIEKGWFRPVAMPITVISLAFLWSYFFIFKLKKISIWSKLSVLCLMAGCMTLVTNLIAKNYVHEPWLTVDVLLNITIDIIFAMVLIVIGMMRKNRALIAKEKFEEAKVLNDVERENKDSFINAEQDQQQKTMQTAEAAKQKEEIKELEGIQEVKEIQEDTAK